MSDAQQEAAMPVNELQASGGSFLCNTPDHIFTVDQFSGDEQLMIQTAEQFSRNEVLPNLERLDAQEEGLSPKLIQMAGDLGLIGVDAPEQFGGLGLHKNLAARILEYMSLNASFSVTFGITAGISQVGLWMFGTEEQKAKYLPKLTSGEWIGAYCLSEPNSGSDALSASTRAEEKDGKWILNGTKMWISNAKWAEFFLVMAKVDGEKFSAFLVERNHPGVSISREEHKLGLKGSSTARVILEDAEIPLENLLHEPGQGHQVALNALNLGRFKLSSMSIGPARDAIGLAANYALDRKQFGKSISEFGLVRKKFAMMAAWFYLAESMIYRTGALIDQAFETTGGTIEGNKKAASEFAVECSACKVLSTELEALIIDEALQCYGGYGFTEEFPIARHYRDARVSRIYEGTNEINRVFIADRLKRLAAAGHLALTTSGDSFISEICGMALKHQSNDQVSNGAISDLVMLTYAEQSSRIRAAQSGGIYASLHNLILPWANARAAEAFQTLTGQAVTLPATPTASIDDIALAVLDKRAPL